MTAVATAGSVGDALGAATDALRAAGVESPRLDAELLLSAAADVARERLIAEPEAPLAAPAARAFGEMVRRRLRREPVAYILGRRWFRGIELEVDRRVLIPRPETELLVEVAADVRPQAVLDLGTGSGAVAIAVARELPAAEVVATDTSPAALTVAAANAKRLAVDGRLRLVEGTLPGDAGFDLLLANLPYVAEDDWPKLAPEIRDWEPREALVAGADGLASIGALLAELGERAGGGAPVPAAVAFEIGAGQCDKVSAMLEDAGYQAERARRDLAGIERVVIGHR